MQALLFVLHALITLIVVAFLLRVLFPLVRADFRNPIGQAVLRVTDPLVLPLRKVLRPAGRVDVASIAALLIVQLAGTALLLGIAGARMASPLTIVVVALRELARTTLQFYFFAVLLHVVLSWVAPGARSPAATILDRLCEPLLAPLRRVVPPLGGLDFTPIFVLIGLQALQILLR
ncbi:MAG TPA: YggT family protein [Steroidobacteraceae bacterium]